MDTEELHALLQRTWDETGFTRGLSTRCLNGLKNAIYSNPGHRGSDILMLDIVRLDRQMVRAPNIGKKTIREIENRLAEMGLSLGMPLPVIYPCDICGKEFFSPLELEGHTAMHPVRPVKKEPLSYFLVLPDGVTPGHFEAAEAFVEAHAELRRKHPNTTFDFFPFAYKTIGEGADPALNAILAIAR